jgi:heme exporter protein A
MIAIEARQLSKSFGRRRVLDELDLDVARGESVAVTGANGAGKTTLLRCLASVLRPTTGSVRWLGRLAAGDPAARRLVGMVAHENRLYPHLTLRENLVFAARMYDFPKPLHRADELLAEIGLRAFAHQLPAELSRGMCQRLAVARAVVHDPPILLMDEPFTGLDAAGAEWLLGQLQDYRARGRTICFAIHDERIVRTLADRILEVGMGRVTPRDAERYGGSRQRAVPPHPRAPTEGWSLPPKDGDLTARAAR